MATATGDPGAAAEFSEMSVTVVCGADCACINEAIATSRTTEKKRFHIIANILDDQTGPMLRDRKEFGTSAAAALVPESYAGTALATSFLARSTASIALRA